ncbi:MAG: oligosaccharide flippase family protein [Oscillospiraceae bacterium]
MEKNNSFIRASAVLVASSMAVKILSAAYRVPLTRMLGAYAMGKYSIVFNLFMPFFALSTAGITPAVSRLATQIKADNPMDTLEKLKAKALALYLLFAIALSAIFIGVGAVYSKSLEEKVVLIGAVILAPNLIFGAVEGVYKGLTQGKMDMLPTAKANLVESVSKVCLGFGSVFFITQAIKSYDKNLPIIASLAAITLSGAVCVVYLYFSCPKPKGACRGRRVKNKELLGMSVPISLSAVTMSITAFFDTAVCLPIIDKIPAESLINSFQGASFKGANDIPLFLFGTYQGMVLTVFNLVPALLGSLGTVSLPVITKAQTVGNFQGLQRQATRLFVITSAVSVPMCVYTFFFCADIINVLFGTSSAQGAIAAELLKIIIPSGVLASFTLAFNAIMHAMKKSYLVFRILMVSAAVKCGLSFVLCAVPQINIRGFALSANVFYAITFVLSLVELKKLKLEFSFFKVFFVPVSAAYIMVLVTGAVCNNLLLGLPLAVKIAIGGGFFLILYGILLILSGFLVDI